MTKTLEQYPEVLTIYELARMLRLRPSTLRKWEKDGRISPIGKGARRRFNKKNIVYKFLSNKE